MRERGNNFKMREINASPTPGKELVEHRNKFINSKSILADIQGVDVEIFLLIANMKKVQLKYSKRFTNVKD